jgi:hypothetical protein
MQTNILSTRWLTTDAPANLKRKTNSQGCEHVAACGRQGGRFRRWCDGISNGTDLNPLRMTMFKYVSLDKGSGFG